MNLKLFNWRNIGRGGFAVCFVSSLVAALIGMMVGAVVFTGYALLTTAAIIVVGLIVNVAEFVMSLRYLNRGVAEQ